MEHNDERYTNYETGLYNRRYYHEQVKSLMCAGVALININGLHEINRKFSRRAGDEVILFVSQVLKLRLHHSDIVCRIGSDEFLIVFRDIDELSFYERLKDIQSICCAYSVEEYPDLKVSVSIGACFREDIADHLIIEAENALYECKGVQNSLIIH